MAGFTHLISLLILLGFLLVLLAFSYLLGKILLKFATNLGVRNHGDGVVRWTSTTKPSLGGILFFFSFLLSIVFYLIILSENVQFNNWQFLGTVISCVLGFVMGLADDAYNTKPLLKFFVQAVCGIVSIICGAYIQIFAYDWMNYMFTIVWFIGLMNSLNMLDNMDAITASVSTVACISMLVFSYITSTLFAYDSILLIGVVASLLAFLTYNWHPAKMYMGDSGSQFLGAFMAAASIKVLWNAHIDPVGFTQTWFFILLPVSFFIVTISDTATVFINRLAKKQSPFVGGKDHTTHHLVYGGFKQRSVAVLYISISIVAAVTGFVMYYFKLYHSTWIVGCFTIFLFTIFLGLFRVTKRYKNESVATQP
jgi:UDP-GlcNAc:undecaprenyl-phosphate GlcNAc-1-phosphate transferase